MYKEYALIVRDPGIDIRTVWFEKVSATKKYEILTADSSENYETILYFQLGMTHYIIQKVEEFSQEMEQTITVYPNHVIVWYNSNTGTYFHGNFENKEFVAENLSLCEGFEPELSWQTIAYATRQYYKLFPKEGDNDTLMELVDYVMSSGKTDYPCFCSLGIFYLITQNSLPPEDFFCYLEDTIFEKLEYWVPEKS